MYWLSAEYDHSAWLFGYTLFGSFHVSIRHIYAAFIRRIWGTLFGRFLPNKVVIMPVE